MRVAPLALALYGQNMSLTQTSLLIRGQSDSHYSRA